MQYTFKELTSPKTYIEAGQSNPLRWEILHKKPKNAFDVQTGFMKCKDFFNDVVAKYKGTTFAIYGFNTSLLKLADDGVWLRLSNVMDYQQFANNVNNTLNSLIVDGDKVSIEDLGDGKVLIFLPVSLFSTTYTISLATYIIRICNNPFALESMDALWKCPVLSTDNPLQDNGKKLVKKWGLFVPEDYKQYWWYAGEMYNSEKNNHVASFIHNNGVYNWSIYA